MIQIHYNITEYQKSYVDSSQNMMQLKNNARIFNETRTIGMTNTIKLKFL